MWLPAPFRREKDEEASSVNEVRTIGVLRESVHLLAPSALRITYQ